VLVGCDGGGYVPLCESNRFGCGFVFEVADGNKFNIKTLGCCASSGPAGYSSYKLH